MGKKDIEKVTPPADLMPEFLRDKTLKGIEATKEYIVLQRLKIIQKSAARETLDQFPVGTVILSPSGIEIAGCKMDDKGRPTTTTESFIFIPLFFFPSWAKVNPVELKGTLPVFAEYTTDKDSIVARKSKDRATREEPYAENPKYKVRYVEMLNFVIALEGGRFELPVIMSFSRGEWMTGSKFLALIRNTRASIFARRWEARSSTRTRNNWDWNGFDVAAPSSESGSPWVSKEQYDAYETAHDELAKQHTEQGLKPDDTEEDVVEGDATPAAESTAY